MVRCAASAHLSPIRRDQRLLVWRGEQGPAGLGLAQLDRLLALDPGNRNAALSARNLQDVDAIRVQQLNTFDLLNHRYLVTDKASLQAFLDGSAWATKEGEAA